MEFVFSWGKAGENIMLPCLSIPSGTVTITESARNVSPDDVVITACSVMSSISMAVTSCPKRISRAGSPSSPSMILNVEAYQYVFVE